MDDREQADAIARAIGALNDDERTCAECGGSVRCDEWCVPVARMPWDDDELPLVRLVHAKCIIKWTVDHGK
jgi:hypothetical protein